jgi:hypothetical protein
MNDLDTKEFNSLLVSTPGTAIAYSNFNKEDTYVKGLGYDVGF